ncbi:MAG TPA: hypothetical protein VG407_05525 [Caulobacteraceae bacterium]|jgi:hypothetical protein|nr:hypothetical protein [Caulobacteraceae bacterium]
MRLSLLGLNVVALGVLIVPAYLIYDATSASLRPWNEICLGAFALGALCIVGAMAGLGGSRVNAARAIPLIALGACLLAVPLTLVVGAVMTR